MWGWSLSLLWHPWVSSPFAAEDIKGSVQHCLLPYLWKEVWAWPFPYRYSTVIRCCLRVFINHTTFYSITTNPTVQRESSASVCLRPCPPCPLILQPVAFAYCVHEVHPRLAILAQKTFSARTCKSLHCLYQTLPLKIICMELNKEDLNHLETSFLSVKLRPAQRRNDQHASNVPWT